MTKAGKATAEPQFPAATDFEQELGIKKAAWEKKWRSATSDQELSLEDTLQSLTKLQQAIAAVNNDAEIKQRLDNQKQKKARELFEKDWLVLENEISKLQAFDNKAAVEARTEATKLREKAAADYIAGVTALAQLNSRIGQAQSKASEQRAPKAAAVKKLGDEVLAAIEELKKNTEKAKNLVPLSMRCARNTPSWFCLVRARTWTPWLKRKPDSKCCRRKPKPSVKTPAAQDPL